MTNHDTLPIYDAADVTIARTIEALPKLPEGYVRVVHLTHPSIAEKIVATGLNYEAQGQLNSTARSWGNEAEVVYPVADPRFNFPDVQAVVFDVPQDEHRLHESVTKSPGIVPAKYLVGVVDAYSPEMMQRT